MSAFAHTSDNHLGAVVSKEDIGAIDLDRAAKKLCDFRLLQREIKTPIAIGDSKDSTKNMSASV